MTYRVCFEREKVYRIASIFCNPLPLGNKVLVVQFKVQLGPYHWLRHCGTALKCSFNSTPPFGATSHGVELPSQDG